MRIHEESNQKKSQKISVKDSNKEYGTEQRHVTGNLTGPQAVSCVS